MSSVVASDPAAFPRIAGAARLTTLLTLGLVIVGAVVRATGSGLACPDWPLCHGRWLPPLEPHVLIEWTHRLLALVVSLCVLGLGLAVVIGRESRRWLGSWALAAVLLLVSQVLLGALTVWQLLRPSVVTLHLVNALLLVAALIGLSEAAGRENAAIVRGRAGDRSSGGGDCAGNRLAPRGLLAASLGLTLAQIVLGGLVSTSHAGLACPDIPGCQGSLVPPLVGRVGLQMGHRYLGTVLVLVLAWTAWRAGRASDLRIRVAARAALWLGLVQVVLGAFNVLLALPIWLSAAHLATAATLFSVLVLTNLRAAEARA